VIWTAPAASQPALDPNGEPGTAGARSRDRQHSQPRACCWLFPWRNVAWWTTAHHQHRWQRRRRFRRGDGLPWRVLGYFGGGARLGSRAQQCSAYGHTRAAPLLEAKPVLNWAVRVCERVEAASSAASVRLALAGVTRTAKTRQQGVALARRSKAAAAVFCVPPSPTTRLWAARRAPIALAHGRPRRGER